MDELASNNVRQQPPFGGILLGVSRDMEIQKRWNSRRFVADLGSVPGEPIFKEIPIDADRIP